MKTFLLIVGTVASMLVFGIAAFFGTMLILMQLGLTLHDNYEYFGVHYPMLLWGPTLIAALAPAVIASHKIRRRN